MIHVTLAISDFMVMLIWAGAKVIAYFAGIALVALAAAACAGLTGRRLIAKLAAWRAGK